MRFMMINFWFQMDCTWRECRLQTYGWRCRGCPMLLWPTTRPRISFGRQELDNKWLVIIAVIWSDFFSNVDIFYCLFNFLDEGFEYTHQTWNKICEYGAFSRSCVGSKKFFWIFCLKMIDYYHKYPLIQNNPLGWF